MLAHVDVRFKQTVVPPADISLKSRMIRGLGMLQQFEVEASIGARCVAKGVLALADPQPGLQINNRVRS